jgi:hypothetical protein
MEEWLFLEEMLYNIGWNVKGERCPNLTCELRLEMPA